MSLSTSWTPTKLKLDFGRTYLIKGTAQALVAVSPSPPVYMHPDTQQFTYDLQLLTTGNPFDRTTYATHYKNLKQIPQPASSACLCLFVCDLNGDQSDADKNFVKKNSCDAIPFVDLNAYFSGMAKFEPVKELLSRYDEEAQAEMVYLTRFPQRFKEQLSRDRFETGPISLGAVNPQQAQELYLCQRLCDALVRPNPQLVWRSLTHQQQYLVFSQEVGLMRNFLCGHKRFLPRGPGLWYCLEKFLLRYPIEDAITLFLAWLRLSERQSRNYEGLFRSKKGFFYFRPSTKALRALHGLGSIVVFV